MTPPANRFSTTRWTLIVAAGRHGVPEAREALAHLCERYWPPLYSFARRQGYTVEQAQDLTQSFFARLLEKRYLEAADPRRGRFRSFLLASFKHFLANERDRERALKRGGAQPLISLDLDSAEARYRAEPVDRLTPEALFERHWALHVLDGALATVREECARAGRAPVFERLQDFLMGDRSPGGYAEAARALGTTEGAVKVTVHRLRRRVRDVLRLHLAATVADDTELEDEIRNLFAVLTD